MSSVVCKCKSFITPWFYMYNLCTFQLHKCWHKIVINLWSIQGGKMLYMVSILLGWTVLGLGLVSISSMVWVTKQLDQWFFLEPNWTLNRKMVFPFYFFEKNQTKGVSIEKNFNTHWPIKVYYWITRFHF